MKAPRLSFAIFLLLAGLSLIGAETFRVRTLTLASVETHKEAESLSIGYNDAVAIQFPREATFLRGVEIELKIPQEILAYRNSMAYGLYRAIKPAPSAATIDYDAERIDLQPLPSRLSFVLQIPLRTNHGLKTGPYATVIQTAQDPRKGPILFRLLPIMKGLPEGIENLQFTVKVKPILANEGGFRLSLVQPGGARLEAGSNAVSVRIDEKPVEDYASLVVLTPGSHHLSVVSSEYRNEVRMFTVEAARITELTVALQGTAPRLFIEAPENAVITVDGVQLSGPKEGREIEPGEHTIQFAIGDYTITRQIVTERGKDYTVSMAIDINVTVSP